MEASSTQLLREIKSHFTELKDIELEQTRTANTGWFMTSSNQYTMFTMARNGRFVWRFEGKNRIQIVDLILGTTKLLNIVGNVPEDKDNSPVHLCFTHIRDFWGLTVFTYNNTSSHHPYIATACLNMEKGQLDVDYTRQLQLGNTEICSTAAVDWWPEKQTAIVLLGSLTYCRSQTFAVRFDQKDTFEVSVVGNEYHGLSTVKRPRIVKETNDEHMSYKGESSKQFIEFREKDGRFFMEVAEIENLKTFSGFGDRYQSVMLPRNQELFIHTVNTRRSNFFGRSHPESQANCVYTLCSFNYEKNKFYDVKMPEVLSTDFEGRTQQLILDSDGILTVLAKREDSPNRKKKLAIRRIPLGKPDKLINMAAIKCIKIGLSVSKFPLQYVDTEPFVHN